MNLLHTAEKRGTNNARLRTLRGSSCRIRDKMKRDKMKRYRRISNQAPGFQLLHLY